MGLGDVGLGVGGLEGDLPGYVGYHVEVEPADEEGCVTVEDLEELLEGDDALIVFHNIHFEGVVDEEETDHDELV